MSHEVFLARAAAVRLGGRLALHDVDLRLAAGELVGLIGPNGAGKTTLLRAILGLLPLETGSISVASGRAGYVPQRHEFAWDFPIDVRGAVLAARVPQRGLLGRLRREDRAAADDAITRVGLSDLATRPVGELSGGQRQRVLVARALATNPSLLLLDEPFTGLDVTTQETLSILFTDLAAEGRTLLMTTHDLPAAAKLCDRLVLLNRTVIADGTPDELDDPDLWLRTYGVATSQGVLGALSAGALA